MYICAKFGQCRTKCTIPLKFLAKRPHYSDATPRSIASSILTFPTKARERQADRCVSLFTWALTLLVRLLMSLTPDDDHKVKPNLKIRHGKQNNAFNSGLPQIQSYF